MKQTMVLLLLICSLCSLNHAMKASHRSQGLSVIFQAPAAWLFAATAVTIEDEPIVTVFHTGLLSRDQDVDALQRTAAKQGSTLNGTAHKKKERRSRIRL
eukprot:s2560_g9.t1